MSLSKLFAKGDVAEIIQFRLEIGESDIAVSRPGCTKCSLQTGTFIKPDFSFGTRKETDQSTYESESICASGFQCVGDNASDDHGCCKSCSSKQLCLSGTISFGGDDAPTWNICPPGFLCDNFARRLSLVVKQCESGTMCLNNRQLSCTDARQIPIDLGYGDIHAGSYCPSGSFGFEFCPIGRYCNSTEMTTSIACPTGNFCPYKTETPQIICGGCNEGATERQIRPLFLIIAIATALLLFMISLFVKYLYPALLKYKKKYAEEEALLASNQNLHKQDENIDLARLSFDFNRIQSPDQKKPSSLHTTPNERASKMMETLRAQINTISNKKHLETIDQGSSKRILTSIDQNNDWMIDIPVVATDTHTSSNGDSEVDAGLIFDKLDKNGDGNLNFDEINDLLKLDDSKIRYFVRRINKLDGAPLDATTVSKRCFVKHFFEVLDKTDDFDADETEAAEIFEAIDLDGSGLIEKEELHSPVLSNIFSDRQIRIMMKEMAPNGQSIDRDTFIRLYHLLLTEVGDVSVVDRGIDISFSNLNLTVEVSGETVHIVDSIFARIQERTMTALMGGSGAGKTSLLNTLCGRAFYGRVSGTILVNGNKGRIENHKHLLGFVPQDDIVYAELTVRENLIYAGRFQLPPETSDDEIVDLADDVIANLGLNRVKDRLVGDVKRRGVSGGEKKRVNIGLELMGKPRILFLDEPTSGLDSSSASLVMASLKLLVKNDGVTVISVIHQPRKFIYELFDNVVLLSVGGRLTYYGNPMQAQNYFGNLGHVLPPGENISDWLLDISTGQLGISSELEQGQSSDTGKKQAERRQYLCDKWKEYIRDTPPNETVCFFDTLAPFDIPAPQGKPSFWLQFRFHIRRNLLVAYRNRKSKLIDCFLIIFAVGIISVLNGRTIFTLNSVIEAVKEQLMGIVGVPLIFIESKEALIEKDTIALLFRPFVGGVHTFGINAMKMCIMASVLVGLSSTKVISEKKLEFYRESSSGYNVNAYFAAVNVTSTLEVIFQMVIAGAVSAVINTPISSWAAYILNFVMLGWGAVSWALLLSVVVPVSNLILVTGFVLSFFNIFLSGGLLPLDFKAIYNSPILLVISSMLAPGRYFLETMIASEYRCLPEQTGFTVKENATSIPDEYLSFNAINVGVWDENIHTQSCNGWYGGYLPAFFVGLTLRLIAGGLLHAVDRSKQSQSSLRIALKQKSFLLSAILFSCLILGSFVFSLYLVTLPLQL